MEKEIKIEVKADTKETEETIEKLIYLLEKANALADELASKKIELKINI